MLPPADEMPRIAGVVVARDEADTIEACLASLTGVDALWVIDNASRDATAERARAAGAEVHGSDLADLGRLRQAARDLIDAEWMIMIDADERLPPGGVERLRRLIAEAPPEVAAFALPIRTRLSGRWLRWGGYYPARRPRVFRATAVRWAPARVHERPTLNGPMRAAPVALEHLSYRDLAHARVKTWRYAALAAQDDAERGRRRGATSSAIRAGWRFLRVVLLRGGWLMGRLGWQLAWLQACGVWWRYRGRATLDRRTEPSKNQSNQVDRSRNAGEGSKESVRDR